MSSPSRLNRLPGVLTDRRTVVKGALATAALGTFRLRSAFIAQESETIATPDAQICVLTPEMIEGPYYVDDAISNEVYATYEGYVGTITIGVDPAATASSGMEGPGGARGSGEGNRPPGGDRPHQ